jgi:hypothetical protein
MAVAGAGLILVGAGQTHVDLSGNASWSDLDFVSWCGACVSPVFNVNSIDNFTVREIVPAAPQPPPDGRIPEPQTIALLGLGLLGITASRRRRAI